jgi:hypothetical protein
MFTRCQFNHQCDGMMSCSTCHLKISQDCECDCDSSYSYCNCCLHKSCHWCSGSTLSRSDDCNDCVDCVHWDYVGDECESDFCVKYLNAQGSIMNNLKCNICFSQVDPLIRVPLAFPLCLKQLIKEYPKFETIHKDFLKYYAYSHTNGVWEPYPQSEFRLAQEYFDFDGGVIVLGRSKDDERKAKDKEAQKIEKELRKNLKKERRLQRLEDKNNEKINQLLSI